MRISIEGNVGSGKSTLLRSLAEHCRVWQEPVEEWQELLQLCDKDRRRWALAMNSMVLLAFQRVPDTPEPLLTERSPLSCKEVFARTHHNHGAMTAAEWQLFCDLHKSFSWVPDVVIYLKSTPNVCMERVATRGRTGEEHVDKEYLSRLQFAHVTMLKYFKGDLHMVDASQEPGAVFERVAGILEAYGVEIFSDQVVR